MLPSQLPDLAGLPVAADTETSGLYKDDGALVSAVSIAWVDEQGVQAYAFPFDQGKRDKLAQGELDLFGDPNLPEAEWVALLQWLASRRFVMHNGKFDCHMLQAGTRQWPGVDLISNLEYDTMLGCRELWPIEPTGLKPTAQRLALLGGQERADEETLKKALKHQAKLNRGTGIGKRYDLLSWDQIEAYATQDAVLTILLFYRQLDEIDTGAVDRRYIDRELVMLKTLYRMEQRGIGFDAAACLAAAARLRNEQTTLAAKMPFQPSLAGAKAYFFTAAGLDLVPYEVTDTGRPQLNDTVLRKMLRDSVPWAPEYQAYRKMDVARSMWYEAYPAMIGTDGRLRTDYRQTKEEGSGGGGAVSGRFSVSRVNLQAIPHASKLELPEGIPTPREFFRAAPGYDLYELDLRQAELRVAAKKANCKTMLELIEDEQDLHAITAIELFNTNPTDTDWFKFRQIAKRGNFSFIFGVGPDTFRFDLFKQTGIELSQGESAEIVNAWRSLYPEFGKAIFQYDRMADRDRYVKLVNGRRRWFYPYEYTHKAFNQVVQGSLAEFAKQWAILTDQQWPGCLLLLIHDSQVMEVPEGPEGFALVQQVAQLGAQLGTRWFKVKTGVDIGLWKEH